MKEETSALRTIVRKTPPPPSPLSPPQKSKAVDEHFGETAAQLMGEIPDGVEAMLKLEIQRLIYQTKYNYIDRYFGCSPGNSNYGPRPNVQSSPNNYGPRAYFSSPPPSSGNTYD